MITLSRLDGIRRAALVERMLKKADDLLSPMYGKLVSEASDPELDAVDLASRLVFMATKASDDPDARRYMRRQ